MAKKSISLETLLVAVDFTSFSEEAAFFASQLASKLKARLIVLHVIHDPAEAPGFYVQKGKKKKYLKTMEEVANEMMTSFLTTLKKAHPNEKPLKKAIPKLVVGTPAARIVEIAIKEKAGMIVIGSQGRTRLSKILLGSKAEQVVKLSTIPVTVVKSKKSSR